MVEIKIYKPDGSHRSLELNPGSSLGIESILPAFDDKLESGLLSLPIEIPWTDSNKMNLGFVENLNSNNAAIPDYWRCDVIDNGVPYLLDGKLKMLTHKGRFDNKRGSYSFTITGIKGLFGTLIKGKSLRDLELGGIISWDAAMDSRQFAFNVMDDQDPANFAKINFAPIAITNFHDNSRSDFNTEYLAHDIVNNILTDPSYPEGWTFGVDKLGSVNMALSPGDPSYNNYRTVPFLNLFFVLRQLFTEHGFTAEGDFFNYAQFNLLHIFNTVSIDLYDYPFTLDVNRQITPNRHLPDMLIVDFLVALQNTFNLKIDFKESKLVLINFKQSLLTSKKIANLSSKCISEYDEAVRHDAYENGVKLEWKWDGADSYQSDKVKEMKDKNIIGEVALFTDIASFPMPITVDYTTYIYVRAENYYYNYNQNAGIWEPAIELHEDWLLGKEQVSFTPELSPLCHYYKMDAFGVINRMNMLAASQHGCYYNDAKVFVEHDFGLRLFYISRIDTASISIMPISFCHNYDVNGTLLADTSLSWKSPDGLYSKFWKSWIDMLINSWIVKSRFILDIVDIHELNSTDILIVNNNQYLLQKVLHDLPIRDETELELVKL